MPVVPCANEITGYPPAGGGVDGMATRPVTSMSASFTEREWYVMRSNVPCMSGTATVSCALTVPGFASAADDDADDPGAAFGFESDEHATSASATTMTTMRRIISTARLPGQPI